jgi:hypothetical protein
VKTWKGPLYAEIYWKKAAPQSENPDQAHPEGAHCVGKNKRTTSITNIRPNKNNNKNKKY